MPNTRGEQVAAYASYVVLAALGLLLGTVGAFLVPAGIVGGFLGISTLVAVLGNLVAGLLGGFGTASKGGAYAPFAGWFLAVLILNSVAPGGDVVFAGRLPADPGVVRAGYAFMIAGLVASIVTIVLTSRYTARLIAPKSQP